MAKITTDDVEYVAGLAQLILDDDTKERLVQEMGNILSYMDKLNELNTDDVDPMLHVLDLHNVYVNCRNHGTDPYALLDEIDLARVGEVGEALPGELVEPGQRA